MVKFNPSGVVTLVERLPSAEIWAVAAPDKANQESKMALMPQDFKIYGFIRTVHYGYERSALRVSRSRGWGIG